MLVIVGAVTRRVRDIMVVLVVGMMLSSGISAVVQIMQYLGSEASLKNFVVWTMGALGDVTRSQLWIFVPAVVAGLILAIASVKSLNLLLFGEEYAVSMGLRIKQSRTMLFISTTLLGASPPSAALSAFWVLRCRMWLAAPSPHPTVAYWCRPP